ncbi:MAG: hypothetical protein AAGF79_08605 [Pseudomonadota bacterium]
MRAALLALAVLAALWVGAPELDRIGTAVFAGIVALPAALLALLGAYTAAMRRQRRLVLLSNDGWARRALTGPVFRIALSLITGLGLAVFLLMRLASLGQAEWLGAAGAVVAVPVGAALWRRLGEAQIAPEYQLYMRLRAGRLFGAAVGLGLYLVLRDAPGVSPDGAFTSQLLAEMLRISAQWQALEAFALGQLEILGDWGRRAAVVVAALGNLALVWAASGLTAALLLTPQARRQAIAPLRSTPADPQQAAQADMRLACAWSSGGLVLAGALCLSLMSALLAETWLRATPPKARPAQIFVTQVEEIGGQYFEPGTIAALTRHQRAVQARAAPETTARLRQQIDDGFDAMNDNVDPFLDWYYSLPAEYAQIGHLLIGDAEPFMAAKLSDILGQGKPFDGLEETLAALDAEDAALRPHLAGELAALADQRSLRIAPDQPIEIAEAADAQRLLYLQDVSLTGAAAETLRRRLRVSGGAAGAAGALTAVVAGKLATRGITGLAARAATKVATSRGLVAPAGAGAGAAAGGLVGSVVPGLGTLLGAAIGGTIGGLAVGVSTDFLLLKLEETLSRDRFRADIVAALDASRAEMQGLITVQPSGD